MARKPKGSQRAYIIMSGPSSSIERCRSNCFLLVNIDISMETQTLMISEIRYRSGVKSSKTDKKNCQVAVKYFVNLFICCLFAVFVRRWKIHFNPCFRFSGAGQNAFRKFGKL